jgi:hypothetical protein
MKKLFTLALVGVFAVAGLQAQNKTDFPGKSAKNVSRKKRCQLLSNVAKV